VPAAKQNSKKRMFGMGFSMKVLLDGEVIARLKARQYVTFYTAPGVHTIGIPDSSVSAAASIILRSRPIRHNLDLRSNESVSAKRKTGWRIRRQLSNHFGLWI
jgi:hypothetical protein